MRRKIDELIEHFDTFAGREWESKVKPHKAGLLKHYGDNAKVIVWRRRRETGEALLNVCRPSELKKHIKKLAINVPIEDVFTMPSDEIKRLQNQTFDLKNL
jgi:hypothetical protein